MKYLNRYLIALLVCAVFFSGCEPLRKKFVRQKKRDKEKEAAFVPVMEPIDYEATYNHAVSRYKYHYSLWRVWEKDIYAAIEERDSAKRIRSLVTSAAEQLMGMRKYLTEDKQVELDRQIRVYQKAIADLKKPDGLRDERGVRRSLTGAGKVIRNNFTFAMVEGNVVQK